jgi:hypothetical protein
MRLTLFVTVLSFTVFFVVLVRRRASQLRLQRAADSLRLDIEGSCETTGCGEMGRVGVMD